MLQFNDIELRGVLATERRDALLTSARRPKWARKPLRVILLWLLLRRWEVRKPSAVPR